MQLAHVSLNFPGTTEEAFKFYESVVGIAELDAGLGVATSPRIPGAMPASTNKRFVISAMQRR